MTYHAKRIVARLAGPAIAAVTLLVAGREAVAQGVRPPIDQTPLFYNYYVGPARTGGVVGQMYPSPRPTPPLVGHTYVTYQPLRPHEFLYKHSRWYYRYHPGSGWTKTKVCWW